MLGTQTGAHPPSSESPLPEEVIPIRQRIGIGAKIIRESVEGNVNVGEKNGLGTAAAHVMPLTSGIAYLAVGVPGPIGLNDFGSRPEGDFCAGNSLADIDELAGAAGDSFDPEGVAVPLDQVTVAPTFPAGFDLRIEGITFIGRTMENVHVPGVLVQWPVGGPDIAAIIGRIARDVRWVWPVAADRSPAVVDGVFIGAIISVQAESDADLALITDTFGTLSLRLGTGQRRQKHCCQNGDDGDHYKQLDQRETGLVWSAGAACFLSVHVRWTWLKPLLKPLLRQAQRSRFSAPAVIPPITKSLVPQNRNVTS